MFSKIVKKDKLILKSSILRPSWHHLEAMLAHIGPFGRHFWRLEANLSQHRAILNQFYRFGVDFALRFIDVIIDLPILSICRRIFIDFIYSNAPRIPPGQSEIPTWANMMPTGQLQPWKANNIIVDELPCKDCELFWKIKKNAYTIHISFSISTHTVPFGAMLGSFRIQVEGFAGPS